jgi:glycosyltransferase involved in cell wall biosynthesis
MNVVSGYPKTVDHDRTSTIVLMPVYEDRQSASKLIAALSKLPLQNLFIVAVEDGSVREELSIDDIEENGVNGEIVYLRRNMGHQRAIAVGLMHVNKSHRPARVIVMDSDGEDTPESTVDLLKELDRGDNDIIVARRRRRSESFGFRMFYLVYKIAFRVLTGRVIHFGNFVALSPKALRRLSAMQETSVHFPGAIIVSKLRVGSIPIDRGRRYFGKSKLNFVGLALHGIRSMMVFAEDILVRVGISCIVLIVTSFILIALAAALKLLGFASPGWFTTVVGVLLMLVMQSGVLTFVTLMMTGIVRGSASLEQADPDALIDRIASTQRHSCEAGL